MTSEEIKEMRERCELAWPGPWEAFHRHCNRTIKDDECAGLGLDVDGPPWATNRGRFEKAGDAVFIAHARDDLPKLLNYIDLLLPVVEDARVIINKWFFDIGENSQVAEPDDFTKLRNDLAALDGKG